jgi:Family of unknown function (DUF6030)
MALAKCEECGHEVSTQAKACPGCGAPVKAPSGTRLGLFLLAVMGVLGLIGFAVRDRSANDQQPVPPSQVFTSTTPTTAPSPPKRTLIRRVPAGNVYTYENAAGETVEEMEKSQGKLIYRRFYRPTLPACAYLRSVGLGTDRYWRDDGELLFHCLSPMTPLGTAAEPYGLLKNNLAYYVDGDAEQAHKLLLKLNVNQRHEAKQAHQALMRAAKALTQQALNTPLPKAAEQAITAGKPWKDTVKAATLELTREDWPTGKGYDLKFLVRPGGQTP